MALTPVDSYDCLLPALERSYNSLINEKKEISWYSRIGAKMTHTWVTFWFGRSLAEIREENIVTRSSAMQFKRAASETYQIGRSMIATLVRDLRNQHQISLSLGCALDQARGELAQAQGENAILVELAHNDPLTGLLNRRGAIERLAGIASAFSHASKNDASLDNTSNQGRVLPCVIVYMDLDNFKPVNTTLGHEGGDKMLQSFSLLLQEVFSRKSDLLVRVGGDEFVVIMPNSDIAAAKIRAQAVLDGMSQNKAFRIHGDTAVHLVSTSIGIDRMVLHAEAGGLSRGMIESLLAKAIKRADHAMMEVKEAGKSGIGIARADAE